MFTVNRVQWTAGVASVERRLSMGGNPGSREPSQSASSRPDGFDPGRMEARLGELLALEFNWNSYGARPIDPACADRARRFYPIMETLGLQPWITPGNNGALIIERAGTDDYSVEFDPNGTATVWFDGLTDADAWALVGMFAQLKGLNAIAGEAGTADTPQSESVHEHATAEGGDAQTPQGTQS